VNTENTDWKDRAEQFLKSHLTDNNSNAEEAAVYFLSISKKIKTITKTIEDSVERWRNDNTRWEEKSLNTPIKAASILRLAQWAEIGALKDFRDNICQNLNLPSNYDFYGCYSSTTAAFYPLVFPLLTSDFAINNMSSKLKYLLHQWQDHLSNLFLRKDVYGFSIGDGLHYSQSYATFLSAFVFGAYRLQYGDIDANIVDKSVQYLLDSQPNSGLWGHDKSLPDSEMDEYPSLCDDVNSSEHTVLAAMGIHALFSANAFGAKGCIEKAAGWLLKQQQVDGGWYQLGDPKYPFQMHTTVMVLDALELAEGGKQTTFTLPAKVSDNSHPGENVTINAHGPIILKHSPNEDEDINIDSFSPDDIKKQIEISQHKLLQDDVNRCLYVEFQKYDSQKDLDPKVKRPSLRKLANFLYDNKLTDTIYSAQAIKDRVKKLVEAGLITDYYAEMRRKSHENSSDLEDLYDRENRNY